MKVLLFLVNYWDCILAALALLAGVIVAVKKGETKVINAFLFSLVTEAERQFGSGTGALKKAAVVQWVYEKLPAFVKVLFTEKNISDLIEAVLAGAKLKWAANSNLLAYITDKPPAGTETKLP
jgi:hypothetical protein